MLGGEPVPGQTPLDDLSGLRDRSIRTMAELNAAEARNIRRAIVKYLVSRPNRRTAPFTLPWVIQLHGTMFGEVWTWAGTLRKRESNIGVRPLEIEVRLTQLLDDVAAWDESGMAADEQAARLHHVAVMIHPFPNGNGRWSRLLANIWLRRRGEAIVEWPEETIGSTSVIRAEYLAAVRSADRGEYEPLVELHRRYGSRQ
jgi:Fic-DOC domain mobile mystery protein B